MHLKDKKITILEAIQTPDGKGGYKTTWQPMASATNIWAYVRYASGSEYIQAAALTSKVEMVFEINYRADITSSHRIRYKKRDYKITFVDGYEDRKTDLKIFAYFTAVAI